MDEIGQAMVRDYPVLANTELAYLQSHYLNCLLSLIKYKMVFVFAAAFVKYIAADTRPDLSQLGRFVFETLRCVCRSDSHPHQRV